MRNELASKSMYLLTLVVCIFVTTISVSAQPAGSNAPWNKTGDPGSINDFNGNLNIGIPLHTIGGRGEAGTTLNLRVGQYKWKKLVYTHVSSSSQATISHPNLFCSILVSIYGAGYPINCDLNPYYQSPIITNVPLLVLDYEKDPGYGPGRLYGTTQIAKIGVCVAARDAGNNVLINDTKITATRFVLNFVSPDGDSLELIDKASMGKFRHDDRTQVDCSSPATDPNVTFSRGREFISTDGSSTTFVSDTDYLYPDYGYINSFNVEMLSYPTGFMYLSNGTSYRIDNGLISWIKDRNGNKTTFSYNTAGKLQTATDSIGNVTSIDYDFSDIEPYGLCDRVRYKGIEGEDKILRISKAPLGTVLREDHQLLTPNQMWPGVSCPGVCGGNAVIFNPTVVSRLWLADNTAYKFEYNSFAEIARLENPSGGAVEYDHGYGIDYSTSGFGDIYQPYYPVKPLTRQVKEKRVFSDSLQNTLVSKELYSRVFGGDTILTVDTKNAENVLLSRRKSYFHGRAFFELFPNAWPPLFGLEQTVWNQGKEYKTEYFSQNGTDVRRRIDTVWQAKDIPWLAAGSALSYDHRPNKKVSIIIENGKALSTLEKFEYDENGDPDPAFFSHLNIKKTKSYHFIPLDINSALTSSTEVVAGMFTENQAASISETDYLYDPAYKARGFVGLPIETRALNPIDISDVLSKKQYVYDETGYFDDSYTTINWVNPNSNLRSNTTTIKTWVKETNSWLQNHAMYDNFGNVRKVWDASGDGTKFVETQYDPAYKYAYPTKVITPSPDPTNTTGSNQTSILETTYDLSTGLPLTVKDDFGQITRTVYDSSLRPARVFGENFTSPETQTIYGVPDASGQLPTAQRFVKIRKQIDADNWDEAITWFDGLGRTIKTQAKDSQGDVLVETHYDEFGRVDRVTNPYRAGETVLWLKTRYDEIGRAVESYAPTDLASLANAQSLGRNSFDISTVANFLGKVVTTTDASGRKARTITNALGQLLRVDEPTGISADPIADLGTLASSHQPTSYKYDSYGKMVEVTQGAQKRWFKYDSLGRLIRVRQPEQEVNSPGLNLADSYNTAGQWTAGFTYDILGNVLTATDANGVTITNTYDRASRIKTRSYSGESAGQATPTVSFYYDGKGLATPQSPNYAKGKLTKVDNGISTTEYTTFDNFGRLTRSRQITDGVIYGTDESPMTYSYNLSGALVEERYPSGRVVKNEFEPDGDLLRVTSQKAGGQFFLPYASQFSYTAAGGITQMKLGNGKWETAKFNTRLQVEDLGLGHSATNAALWKVNYTYGELQTNGTVDTAKNTGNIAKQTLTIPGATFVQNYKYDSLYRLKEAVEPGGESTTNWSQTFDYDRYGNRAAFTQTVGGVTTHNTTPDVDNKNRFTNTDFVYDDNGNVIQDKDPITTQTRLFTFNGDNRQIEVIRNGTSVGKYFYDGEGKRIKKVTNSETTVFVYSSGKLVAEYSTLLSQNPTISYTTTDHLGSPRIITDQLGQVKSRRDFMPFGEDLFNGVGARSPSLQYGSNSDDVRQKFAGYLKDSESGLDFAEARMYENRYGRFTAVDPLLASGKSALPQTFNRYVYVSNNPMLMTDPTGLDPWWKQRIGNTDRYNYVESRNRPAGDGWEEVKFGNNWYVTVGEWNDTGRTAYLYNGGGQDMGFRFNRVQSMANFFNPYSETDPRQIAARNEQVRNGAADVMGMGGAVWNGGAGAYNLGAFGTNYFGGREILPYLPEFTPETNGQKFFYYGTNAAFLAQGGVSLVNSVRSGITNFRAGGVTFGEQLFNSNIFGKSSTLFGNNQYGGASGILNRPGSFFKAGWSGGRQEMSFVNPRYANGLVLDAKTMGRSSFTGGGRQFRFTIGQGSTPSQGGRHLFIPRTFVPDSIANPLMY